MRVIVSGRSVGSRKPLFADWSVPLPPDDFGAGGLTLRDVIGTIVRSEVRMFAERREARRLDRVMTRGEIESGEAAGKISPEGREAEPDVDVEAAMAAAWQAFEDGLYLVVIDEQEHRELDAQVFLKPDSRITFVRLVFLAGW
jgi:hypothetical protein